MDLLTPCLKSLFVNEKIIFDKFTDKINEREKICNVNFRRCPNCYNGFIGDSSQKQSYCTECKKTFCSGCNEDWMDEHNDRTCLGFAMYKKEYGVQSSSKTDIQKYLSDCKVNGEIVRCPKCKIVCVLG